MAITTFRGAHISVDLLWEYCGAANKRRIDIAAGVFVLLFFALLAWMTWQKVFDSGSQVTADLRLPLAYFYAAAALGAGGARREIGLGAVITALEQEFALGGSVPEKFCLRRGGRGR